MVDSGHIFFVKMLFIYTPSKYPGVEQTTPAQLVLEIAISNSLCSVVLPEKNSWNIYTVLFLLFLSWPLLPNKLMSQSLLKEKSELAGSWLFLGIGCIHLSYSVLCWVMNLPHPLKISMKSSPESGLDIINFCSSQERVWLGHGGYSEPLHNISRGWEKRLSPK